MSGMQDAEVTKSLVTFEQSLKTSVCFCSFCLGVLFEISGQSSYQFNKFPSKSGFHNIIQYRPFLMKKQCYQQVYYFYPRLKSTMIYGSRAKRSRFSRHAVCVVSIDKELYSTLSLFTQAYMYKLVWATYCWG